MQVLSDTLLTLVIQGFQRVYSVVYIFPENRDFSETCSTDWVYNNPFWFVFCISAGQVLLLVYTYIVVYGLDCVLSGLPLHVSAS